MRKQLLISLGILVFLFLGTIIAIIYGKGYQIDFRHGRPEISGTGLLVTTSIPDGAQVLINDHLTTATNNTINLAPGSYNVTIQKEGYYPWHKTIQVQKEVVSKATATLFPNAPKLESITDLGINNPALDPSGTKIAFTVASQSANSKNGIYVLSMNANPLLTLQGDSTQIIDDTVDTFSTATLSWSPDGQSILATITNNDRTTNYLLNANGSNASPKDITETLSTITDQWAAQRLEKANARIAGLQANLKAIVQNNFTILSWSPDETKILYTASASASLPLVINPPLIGADSTPQQRNIQKGNIYVYDIKEDKNFLLLANPAPEEENGPKFTWMPDNAHLLYVHDKRIDIVEYDGSNDTTMYAGPFFDHFVFPWPTGGKFVMLTNLGNTDTTPNLYTVGLQ
ncbi:MAG TPA: PEGA domain-containing protein [Patescibacteria group bacterium]